VPSVSAAYIYCPKKRPGPPRYGKSDRDTNGTEWWPKSKISADISVTQVNAITGKMRALSLNAMKTMDGPPIAKKTDSNVRMARTSPRLSVQAKRTPLHR